MCLMYPRTEQIYEGGDLFDPLQICIDQGVKTFLKLYVLLFRFLLGCGKVIDS